MPRRSLKPELNKIRAWVRQGRTDAWIAHQLEVTVQQIETFKRDQHLDADDGDSNGATPDPSDDLDLRAEDDAMVAAELDAAAAEAAERDDEDDDEDAEDKPRRRRSRAGAGGHRVRRPGRRGIPEAQAPPAPQPARRPRPPAPLQRPAGGDLRPRR